ncbi:hypothetical protein OIE69_01935 [Actinacidiphila glaucinigra]|uniref:hypothetical protein n=1 Tax=Actinacidiphila glaucinigra TaxID=235986 RepID=UPI002DDBD407|nr:hypothetical protein [Actinacidiphila glaucinigra]WSD57766.1 hypothetical protein OIE69_01935 [Actinacidiphila glaucinigra]
MNHSHGRAGNVQPCPELAKRQDYEEDAPRLQARDSDYTLPGYPNPRHAALRLLMPPGGLR